MSVRDMRRLKTDLDADAGLQARVAEALSDSPAAAAALLQGLGYDVSTEDLRASGSGEPASLSETELDGVVGGVLPIKNTTSPFG
ncbi:Nif11 family protein [Azospirillum sp. ST 5-10]|uniref:Nif11 family protein n=1 Tax=unclassified Azospirillum TaxID=2630922 RepID=UPI003F49C205